MIGFQELHALDISYALAVVHWHTKIDVVDVEFVLRNSLIEEQKVRRVMSLELLVGSKEPKSMFES